MTTRSLVPFTILSACNNTMNDVFGVSVGNFIVGALYVDKGNGEKSGGRRSVNSYIATDADLTSTSSRE
jgi:hypothetical protein